jgi:hypothetical protein
MKAMSDEERFLTLFCPNTDSYTVCYSVAKKPDARGKFKGKYATCEKFNGAYYLVKRDKETHEVISRQPKPDLIEAARRHLDGIERLVLKPQLEDGTCMWGALDHDPENYNAATCQIISEAIRDLNLPLYPFPSKSGGLHSFAFTQRKHPGTAMNSFLTKSAVDLGDEGCEVNPKPVGENKKPYGIEAPFFGAREEFRQFSPVFCDELVAANGDVPPPSKARKQPKPDEDGARKLIPVSKRYNYLLSRAGEYRHKGDTLEAAKKKVLLDFETNCEKSPADNKDGEDETKHMVEQVWATYEAGALDESAVAGRPPLTVEAGLYPELETKAEQILLQHCQSLGIYQRGGEVVRVRVLTEQDEKEREAGGIKRPVGNTVLWPVNPDYMRTTFEKIIYFNRLVKGSNGTPKVMRADCPKRLANSYLTSDVHLPVIKGLVHCPFVRPDGSVFAESGYDASTGLYLVTSGLDWLPVPDHPTQDDAERALATLTEPFSQFPFVKTLKEGNTSHTEEAALAVHLACILTAIQCPVLTAVPMFCTDSPTPRTGKDLLLQSACVIATGMRPPTATIPSSHEEWGKVLLAMLREAQNFVLFGNVQEDRGLYSTDLCKVLTEDKYTNRLLGTNTTLTFSTRTTLFSASGNNLILRGDLTVRSLMSTIDADMEFPEYRRFKIADLLAYVGEHRRELVRAALTIIRAYRLHVLANGQRVDLEPWGGFEQWSESIREALVWSGAADPCLTRKRIMSDDPEKIAITNILERLKEKKSFSTNEVLKDAESDQVLMDNVLEICRCTDKKLSAYKIGCAFRRWENRPLSGLKLRRVARLWTVDSCAS